MTASNQWLLEVVSTHLLMYPVHVIIYTVQWVWNNLWCNQQNCLLCIVLIHRLYALRFYNPQSQSIFFLIKMLKIVLKKKLKNPSNSINVSMYPKLLQICPRWIQWNICTFLRDQILKKKLYRYIGASNLFTFM